MASTTLTRSGTFDGLKLAILRDRLRGAVPGVVQVNTTATGLSCLWPDGLTAPQQTAATALIAAYVQPTDASFLTPLQQSALTFLGNASPSAAQQLAALKGAIKTLLAATYNQPLPQAKIDAVDLTT